jgi:hypothetical protein
MIVELCRSAERCANKVEQVFMLPPLSANPRINSGGHPAPPEKLEAAAIKYFRRRELPLDFNIGHLLIGDSGGPVEVGFRLFWPTMNSLNRRLVGQHFL